MLSGSYKTAFGTGVCIFHPLAPLTADNFFLAASGYSQPLRGWIEVGDTSIPKQAWDVFQNG